MNIIFFLTPKSQIKYLEDTMSIRQALEIFEHYRFTVLPIITKEGKYYGSISEGDLLYYIKNNLKFNINDYNNINIKNVPTYRSCKAINVREEIKPLIQQMMNQNFVPVVDDLGAFIGIITRKSIIEYLEKRVKQDLEKGD